MKKYLGDLKFYVFLFLGVIVLFVALLTAAFMIPNHALEENQQNGLVALDQEGQYPAPLFGTVSAVLDNYSDELMLTLAIKPEGENSLYAAMDAQQYSRYWQGYQVLLRPALVFLNYYQIRYFSMLLFFSLLGVTASFLHQKMGLRMAIAFLVAIGACIPVLVSVCMLYAGVFLVMFIGCIWVLRRYGKMSFREETALFLILGMVTNYIDLLSAPLLTLGMPLMVLLFLEVKRGSRGGVTAWRKLLVDSLFWGIGYGGCWGAKWAIGSLVLQRNVFDEAMFKAVQRVTGDGELPLSRSDALEKNFTRMFLDQGLLPVLVVVLVIWLLVAVCFRVPWRKLGAGAALLALSVYPYLWMLVLVNHSQIHNRFTYRIQAITVFGVFCFLELAVDWDRARRWIAGLRRKSALE